MIQLLTTEKMRGDNKQPWRTPVCTLKDDESVELWMTWHLLL